ncbi:MAG: tRNA(His) guanylyltransferase Thg1 family protein [Pseudanabaena sp. ELA748]
MQDDLGDRMKTYEGLETAQRFIPLLPVVIRLDGRSFSAFTANMAKPYDIRMTRAMADTTKALVAETNAVVGYTQSDEISLILYSDKFDSQIWFDGKKFKTMTCLASYCSVTFYKNIVASIPELASGPVPTFDCRAWNVPNKVEAMNYPTTKDGWVSWLNDGTLSRFASKPGTEVPVSTGLTSLRSAGTRLASPSFSILTALLTSLSIVTPQALHK